MKLPSSSSNPELTDQLVEEVEQLVGCKLPKSYIDLMKQWNGGLWDTHQFDFDKYTNPKDPDESWGQIWVDGLSGISTDAGEHHSIAGNRYTLEEWEMSDDVLLLHYLGGKWIAFDYGAQDDEPPVIIITDDGEKTQLACNFAEFCERLELLEFDEE